MSKSEFGMIGLGTMGRNFLLNVADQGIAAVGFDLDASRRAALLSQGPGLPISTADDLPSLIKALRRPCCVMLMLPAGPTVDSVMGELVPYLDAGDLIIDGGNSHFQDTDRRIASLGETGIGFLGVGVSGGEKGARHGPCIMAGGSPEYYERVRGVFESVSAKFDGESCAALVGRAAAGHFTKMVHNGIEYAMMQLIAEVYDLLKHGCIKDPHLREDVEGVHDADIAEIFAGWNHGRLKSFLIEITATVLRKRDPETGNSLVSMILDTAGQKGTGKWTSQAAMDLGVPVPTIDSAVTMRQISSQKALRTALAGQVYPTGNRQTDKCQLEAGVVENALYCAFIAAYAQGIAMLSAASAEMSYELELAEIAKIWRGGCIIRAEILEEVRTAITVDTNRGNIIASPPFAAAIGEILPALQQTVVAAMAAGIPCMALSASLNYLRALATPRLPANLIQAQRDLFGAHTYERIDKDGVFHTDDWHA